MMYKIFIFLLNSVLCSGELILSEDEYNLMPPRFHLDPYEECIREDAAVYCDVQFSLVSEDSSPLLTMIQDYSAFTHKRFNHSKLHYGICLSNTCKNLLERTDVDLKYTLEACLNKTMWEAHKLKTKVSEYYNCNLHKKKLNRNIADTIVAIACVLILLINIIASLWDVYYPVNNKAIDFLLCFSILQNLKKLSAPVSDKADPRLAKLQCIHGFRAITMCMVITVHALLPCYVFSNNAQFVEGLYEDLLNKLFLNGTGVIQTFFVMSGFLVVYNCLLYEERKQFTPSLIPIYLVKRYIRLTIPYALVLGLSATWLRYLPNGPLWQKLVGREAEDCRKYWWRHMLYINNYYDDSECMLQIWYLGSDMQMAVVGIVTYFLCKNTYRRKILLSALFLVGVIIPGLHTYFQDLDANMILNPESIVSVFMDNDIFNKVYKRGHTNLAGYTIGLAMGYLMYHWENIGVKAEKLYKYRYLYRSLFILGLGLVYSGSIFYEDRPRDPMYFRVLYSVVVRAIYLLLLAGTIAGAIFGIDNLYRSVLEWKLWKYLSRVSYSTYLLHVVYIRQNSANIKTAIEINALVMGQLVTQALVMSIFLGLVFWTLVEAPLGNVMNLFSRPAPLLKSDTLKVSGQSNGCAAAKTKDE